MATHSKPVLGLPIHPLPLPPHLTRRPLVLAFLVLLLLRARTLAVPREALAAVHRSTRELTARVQRKLQRKLSPEEMAKVLQQVYVEEADGSRTLLVPYRDRIVKVPIHTTPPSRFTADISHFPLLPAQTLLKPNIDLAFLAQLRAILTRIAIPAWRSQEAGIVVLHSSFLVLRTVLSILVARLDGRIVRDLVRADGKGFMKGLALWFLLAIPSTFTNSMIRHFQSLLALRLRTRLTRYLHDLYLSSNPDLRYFRAPNYLESVDQYLTADVEAWANALSGVYGNVLKPSLDLLLFTSQLSRSLGVRGTLLLFLNYYGTVSILRAVTPAFGKLAAVEARLEGEYRAGMGRVGREAEEVAFYDGGGREREVLGDMYLRLIKHVNSILKIRIAYEWTEDYVIKYLWSAAGYALIAVPILYTRAKRSLGGLSSQGARGREQRDEAVAGRTETYISNRRLLLSLADAGGRLMYAYKDLLELAGLTTRLYTLISTLLNMPVARGPLRVEAGAAVGLLQDGEGGKGEGEGEVRVSGVDVRVPRGKTSLGKEVEEKEKEKEGEGEGRKNDPPLVKDLTLSIRRGEHLMITGSNGVGKTAVARVLAGLWEPSGSGSGSDGGEEPHVQMPRDETEADVLFRRAAFLRARDAAPHERGQHQEEHWRPRPTLYVVPQRAYMVAGSLLEQIIYPCSYASFVRMTSVFHSPSSHNARGYSSDTYPPTPGTPTHTRPALLSRSSSVASLTSLISSTLLPPAPSSLVQMPSAAALAEIHNILEKVHLGYLVGREGGLHVRKEWRDVLSGGEKQRMAMARVLWWRPRWAVLDECTSAVSSDVEGRMYEAAKALDITLITISLRPSLMKYHKQLLTLHGPADPISPGRWTLARVGTPEERMSLQKEIGVLEERLCEVGAWEARVRELERMLGVQEAVHAPEGAAEDGEGHATPGGARHREKSGEQELLDRAQEEEERLRTEEMREEVYVYDYREPEGYGEDAEERGSVWSAGTGEDVDTETETEGSVGTAGTDTSSSIVDDGFEDALGAEEMALDVEEEMTFA